MTNTDFFLLLSIAYLAPHISRGVALALSAFYLLLALATVLYAGSTT